MATHFYPGNQMAFKAQWPNCIVAVPSYPFLTDTKAEGKGTFIIGSPVPGALTGIAEYLNTFKFED